MLRNRWVLCILLFLLVTINYGDRVALSIGAKPIAAEFGISPIGMGYLLSCFLWSYVLCLIPWGMAVDRVGLRLVSALGIALWSLATIVTGFASSLTWLFGARLAMGAGEASAFPAAGRAVREWIPASEYGFANMLVISGGYAGPAIGAVAFGWFAQELGWRGAFEILGAVGFAWLLAALIWFRRPADIAAEPLAAKAEQVPGVALGTLLSSTSMWGLFLTQGACVYSHYLFLTWLPSYLQETRHLTILKTGALSAAPFAATVICSLAVGKISDRLLRNHSRETGGRRWMVALMLMVSAVVLFTPMVTNIWLVLLLVTISLTGTSAATGLNSALLTDLLPSSSQAGTATGVLVVGGNVFGMMAPIVTGYVIAGTGSYDAAWLISGVLLLAGMIITVTMTRRQIGADVPIGATSIAPTSV